jgi:hypothetical protein
MTIRSKRAACLAVTAFLGAAAPAMAQDYYYLADGRQIYQGRDRAGYVDRYGWPSPWGGCVKMCASDNLPCDPIYFKTADGRCTSNAR